MEDIIITKYRGGDQGEVLALYEDAGWVNYTRNPVMLKCAWENSLAVYAAYKGKALIGACRLVGDGYSVIVIQDILVIGQYQGQGIGSKLLKEALKDAENVYQKLLLTDDAPGNAAFYEKAGFKDVGGYGMRAYIRL